MRARSLSGPVFFALTLPVAVFAPYAAAPTGVGPGCCVAASTAGSSQLGGANHRVLPGARPLCRVPAHTGATDEMISPHQSTIA